MITRHPSRVFPLAAVLLAALLSPTAGSREVPTRPFPLPPAWVQDQTLYEVNLRQFSDTGDVEGLRKQLPRLKELGVGTLWIMPVHPIGEKGRSGSLGSPYAVRDYRAFNPEFGTIEQFKQMVDEAHRLGLYVIIDWVGNHTALDHPWIQQHPDWYKRNDKGEIVHPQPTWKDIASLNFDSAEMRKEMIASMAYWVREVGVDGFRCDAVEFMPLDFWSEARTELRKIKPIFLLGEIVAPAATEHAFDASYAWHLTPNTEQIVAGKKTVTDLVNYIRADQNDLRSGGFRLNFTTNHDKNAWEGTTKDLLGDGVAAFTVLTFTLPGMPLIYNGQEAGPERRLAFFERDPIRWPADLATTPMSKLLRSLSHLKRDHRALWAGDDNAPAQIIEKSTTAAVLTFRREVPGDQVVVMLNLSAQPAAVPAPDLTHLTPALGAAPTVVEPDGQIRLQPWEYRVWTGRR